MSASFPEKLFYRIGEVAEITGINSAVLRYWESRFPQLRPRKNRAGQRIYEKRDVEFLLEVKTLLYDQGYKLSGVQKKLEEDRKKGQQEDLVQALQVLKEDLESILRILDTN